LEKKVRTISDNKAIMTYYIDNNTRQTIRQEVDMQGRKMIMELINIDRTLCATRCYQGYNRTGVNQIIKEVKVAKTSFYQHFKSN